MSELKKPVDIIALEQHFPQELTACYDHQLGDGLEVLLDRGAGFRPLMLQVFPDTQVAHLSTALLDVTLRHARVAVDEYNDVLELKGRSDEEWVEVMLKRNGAVTIATFPSLETAEEATDMALARTKRPSAQELSEGSRRDEEDQTTERGADDHPEAPALPSLTADVPNNLEHERVTFTGRVGVEPRFRTTKNDRLVCNFPLAVHTEDGSTTWHDVVAFGERAIKLQDSLHKGQEVQVVGYVHAKQVPGKNGTRKEKREVWAAVVRKQQNPVAE